MPRAAWAKAAPATGPGLPALETEIWLPRLGRSTLEVEAPS